MTRRRLYRPLFAALVMLGALLLGIGFATEKQNTGRYAVLDVVDGDTIVIDYNGDEKRIRLAQIDAPENAQDYGLQSKLSLTELLWGKSVDLNIETTDRYGRLVADVLVDGKSVNALQVKRGEAWAYRRYVHDDNYLRYEVDAQQARLGLWADNNPIPPWEFRASRRR